MPKSIEYGIRGGAKKAIVQTHGSSKGATIYAKIKTPSSSFDRRTKIGHAGVPHPTRPPA
jgi:hypothetical protein